MPSERFDFSDLDDDELYDEYVKLKKERDEDYAILEDPSVSSELKSELRNADIPYANDKIAAFEVEIDKRLHEEEKGRKGR